MKKDVCLLGNSRNRSRLIESERKKQRRDLHAKRSPGKQNDVKLLEDPKAEIPGKYGADLHFLRERSEVILPLLKDRDKEKVNAVIECGGDFSEAAAMLGISPAIFRRRWRETTLPNVKAAILMNDSDQKE